MSDFEKRIAELDIHISGDCLCLLGDPEDHHTYVTFVRQRRPAPPVASDGTVGWTCFMPGWPPGSTPEVGVTVFGRDGKPVWRFADESEVYNVDDFIGELDRRLPPLDPKQGAS